MMGKDGQHQLPTLPPEQATPPSSSSSATSSAEQPRVPHLAIVPPDQQEATPLMSPPIWVGGTGRAVPPPPIPNIIVDPVPARDAFGHSRTPPFVPSPSQWALPLPTLGKKSRAHSDSSIVDFGRAQELAPFPRPPASAIGLPMKTGDPCVFRFDLPYRPPASKDNLTVPGPTDLSQPSSVPMETDRPDSASPTPRDRPPLTRQTLSPESSLLDPNKPNVPFSWHFQGKPGSHHEKSPKMYWLRRHSDSNLPSDPASPPSSADSPRGHHEAIVRGKSEGDTPLHSPVPLMSHSESVEEHPAPSPKRREEGVVSKQLKVKKYLQKRYQLSLKRVRQSSDTDDVFSPRPETPSPGFSEASFNLGLPSRGRGLSESSTSTAGESEGLGTRSEEHRREEPGRKPSLLSLKETVPIKTEPISSCESEGEADQPETPVFTSPLMPPAAQRSHSEGSWQGASVFQFHAPMGSRPTPPKEQHIEVSAIKKEPIPQEFQHFAPRLPTQPQQAAPLPPFSSMLQRSALQQGPPPAQLPAFPYGRLPSYPPSTPLTGSSWDAPTSSLSQTQSYQGASAAASHSKTEPSKIIYCPFSEKVQEQRHSRDPNPTFMCPVCSQVFPSYNYLANHMVNHLPSEVVTKGPGDSNKIHLCKVCNRAFSRSDMLTRHMRLHTGLRPYECRVCGQVFSRSDHLHTHLRTHTGEKPYKCPQCPYAAPRRDMITRHMRIHMKQFSRRGRRSSSVSSDVPSEAPASQQDVKRRNQSLSSVESQDSTESLFRRSSTASEAQDSDSPLGKSRSWSSASTESMEPQQQQQRHWSATSVESAESYPSPRPEVSRGHYFSFHHGSEGSSSGEGARGLGVPRAWGEESIEEGMEHEAGHLSPASDSLGVDIHSSFQKCKVTSDKESTSSSSSERTMSPSGPQTAPTAVTERPADV